LSLGYSGNVCADAPAGSSAAAASTPVSVRWMRVTGGLALYGAVVDKVKVKVLA
jgi:hypothetical protein